MKKFCAPTHLDKGEFGEWWVMDNGPIYFQANPDKEEKPHWVPLGDLFMAHLRDHWENPYEELSVVLKSMTIVPLTSETPHADE